MFSTRVKKLLNEGKLDDLIGCCFGCGKMMDELCYSDIKIYGKDRVSIIAIEELCQECTEKIKNGKLKC